MCSRTRQYFLFSPFFCKTVCSKTNPSSSSSLRLAILQQIDFLKGIISLILFLVLCCAMQIAKASFFFLSLSEEKTFSPPLFKEYHTQWTKELLILFKWAWKVLCKIPIAFGDHFYGMVAICFCYGSNLAAGPLMMSLHVVVVVMVLALCI